jgi:hypothetical protein
MTILDKMSVDDLMKVRKMNKGEAEQYLKSFNLTHEEVVTARKLVTVKDKHHDNRLWLATAWLLGATFAQLARDKGVTKQSVMVQVDKLLPLEERKAGRMSGMALSLEALSEYKVKFFESIGTITDFTPKEAALWLLTHTSLDIPESVSISQSRSKTDLDPSAMGEEDDSIGSSESPPANSLPDSDQS